MKQKIRFEKNIKDGILTVLESSEVDPGLMMPLHEEEYSLEEMVAAHKQGFSAFLRQLRRRSFFPHRDLCKNIFDSTAVFFSDAAMDKLVVEYSDVEFLPTDEEFLLEEDDVELDDLLEEDGDTKEDEMKEIDSEDDTPRFTPEDISEHEN